MLRRALAQPLLHFLLVGALIFWASELFGPKAVGDERRLVIPPERVEQLAAGFAKQWRRQPDPTELQGLIDEFVREEILYREGMALGLDRDDTVIRRRVVQKVEFLIEDLVASGEPDEVALAAFYAQNSERFRAPARLGLHHIYFSSDRRGDGAAEDARQLLDELVAAEASGSNPAAESGDPFMLSDRYRDISRRELAAQLGDEFAAAVFALSADEWHGPIESSYGFHLVRVSERADETLPPFTDVRERVRAEYLDEQRRLANDVAIRRLRDRYEIVVEPSPPDRSGEPRAALGPDVDGPDADQRP